VPVTGARYVVGIRPERGKPALTARKLDRMTQGQPDTAAAERIARAQLRARLALTALLLVLVAAGIRAADPVITSRGPLHRDGAAVAAGLELVLIGLLVAASRRKTRLAGSPPRLPYLLNSILVPVLWAGVIVLPVAAFLGLLHDIHLNPRTPAKPPPGRKAKPPKTRLQPPPGSHQAVVITELVLLTLAVIAVLACLLLIVRWRRAARVSYPAVPDEDFPARLGEAVQAGRRALAGLNEARAAIIACYVAMEQSLATAGAVRAVAETPDELLARAVAAGLVRGEAAGQLTALFYQARFSARPLPGGSLAAARQALTEMAAELGGAAGSGPLVAATGQPAGDR
jgi:uncharacterized membrane protein YidH (DUF202 family)